MKRISKAINEGLNLIDFGNSKILKSKSCDNPIILELGDKIVNKILTNKSIFYWDYYNDYNKLIELYTKFKYHYTVYDEKVLQELIHKIVNIKGNNYNNFNWIDVSNIETMNLLFNHINLYKCDLSEWDVSNVKDMSWMFFNCQLNTDLSKWNVSNVENMENMFRDCSYICKCNISNWDVSNVENMRFMFYNALFNEDISNWTPLANVNMRHMFNNCPLETTPPHWYHD